MSQLKPIWQHLPFHFKQSIVSNLNYKSRCNLRICSKNEKNIVDSYSPIIDYLCLSLSEPAFSDPVDPEKPARISLKDKNLEFSKNFTKDDVIEKFLSVFSNISLSVKTLEIHVWGLHRNSQQFKFFKSFLTEINNRNLKFKVRKLELTTVFPDKNQLISLIECLDIDFIESINLMRATGFQFGELSKTDQFKKLKELKIETRHQIDPEWVSHLDKFQITAKRMNAEIVSEIIKNFIGRNPPNGSYFSIRSIFPIGTNRAILRRTLENITDSQDYPTPPVVIDRLNNNYFLYSRKFKLNNPNCVLIVFVFKFKVSGIVCNIGNIERELQNFNCS